MLEKIQASIIAKGAYIFSKPLGAIPVFFAILLFLALSIGAAGVVDSKTLVWVLSLVLGVFFTAIIGKLVHPPKFSKNSIGILLAVNVDSDESENRLKHDLAQSLQNSLQEANTSLPIEVQVLQQFHSLNVFDTQTAKHYAHCSRARFVIFGSLSKRKIKAEDHYVLLVKSLVTHTPTTKENQSTLRKEMSEVLPGKANIAASNDFEGLELTGHLFGIGSQYVIAVALFLSGDKTSAIEVLDKLNSKLNAARLPREWPGSKRLESLVPKRLLDFQLGEIDYEYFQWRTDHDLERLKRIDSRFSSLPENWKKDARYLNIRAICHFILHNNVMAARQLVAKVGSIAPESISWRYSLAFLDAYEGKILEARASYLKAFRHDNTSDIALEVEEFLAWMIQVEETKVQFLFFLGFINFKKKKDHYSAKRDFSSFLASQHSGSFPALILEATALHAQCNSNLAVAAEYED